MRTKLKYKQYSCKDGCILVYENGIVQFIPFDWDGELDWDNQQTCAFVDEGVED